MNDTTALISNALHELNRGLHEIGTCGDGNCIIEKPVGMHTNGGCRCSADRMTMQKYSYYHNRFKRAVTEALK